MASLPDSRAQQTRFCAESVAMVTNMQEISKITRIVAITCVLDKTSSPPHPLQDIHCISWDKLGFFTITFPQRPGVGILRSSGEGNGCLRGPDGLEQTFALEKRIHFVTLTSLLPLESRFGFPYPSAPEQKGTEESKFLFEVTQ